METQEISPNKMSVRPQLTLNQIGDGIESTLTQEGCDGSEGANWDRIAKGATRGAVIGAAFGGPTGSVVGGAIGAVAGAGLFGGNDSVQIYTNIANDVIAKSFMESISSCTSETYVSQGITVNCNADDLPGDGCSQCQAMVNLVRKNRENLMKDAILRGRKGNYFEKFQDEALKLRYNEMAECKEACKSCITNNLSQSLTASFNFGCATYSDIATNMATRIQGNVEQAMTQKEDALSKSISLFGNDTTNCMSLDLANRIVKKISATLVETLVTKAQATQTITIVGNSYIVNNVNQEINLASMTQIVAETGVANDLYTEEELKVTAETEVNNDTLQQIFDQLLKTVSNLGSSVEQSGYYLTAMVLVFVIIALLFAVLVLFDAFAMNWFVFNTLRGTARKTITTTTTIRTVRSV